LVNAGEVAVTAQDYLTYLPLILPKITKLTHIYGPMVRASLLVGTSDLQNNKSATVDQVKVSMQYKAALQAMINEILKLNPTCKLVLCTNFDQNNGGMGSMAPYPCPGLIKEFNKRIFELGKENKLTVADLYTVMMGHPEYYVPTDTHPNNAGHAVIASTLEGIFDTSPGAHQPKPGATPPAYPEFKSIYVDPNMLIPISFKEMFR
jgi:lysophospholipase L1-like esterase